MKHAWEMNESELLELTAKATRHSLDLQRKGKELEKNKELNDEIKKLITDSMADSLELLAKEKSGKCKNEDITKALKDMWIDVPEKYVALLRKTNLYTEEELDISRLLIEVSIMQLSKK